MRKSELLNASIAKELSVLGHTQYIVVSDVGLPVDGNVKMIDLSVTRGTPGFLDVLQAIAGDLVYESFIYAGEMEQANPEVFERMKQILGNVPGRSVSHEDFKHLCRDARAVIRTGECSSYSNVILVGGVDF